MDTLNAEQRRRNMSRIRGKDTKPEVTLRSLLHHAGFRFRLHQRNLPGKPDIVLRKYCTVIFVNGCFWHRHQGCKNATMPSTRREFWLKKLDANVRRDARNYARLQSDGWTVLTVWECELEADATAIVRHLSQKLRKVP